jgi:hypothetical protein
MKYRVTFFCRVVATDYTIEREVEAPSENMAVFRAGRSLKEFDLVRVYSVAIEAL